MLSRTKGQRYGEGHQKAPQISTGLLPLVAVLRWEEARCLPGQLGLSAMLGMLGCVPVHRLSYDSVQGGRG
jgi:hypothetical protein